MKVNSPTVLALVLWFLFFASHIFAVFKSPYPRKAQRPDQITIISDGSVGPIAGTNRQNKLTMNFANRANSDGRRN